MSSHLLRRTETLARRKRSALSYINPFSWLSWSADFLVCWILTRPFARLAPAIPCLIVMLLMAYLGTEQYVRGSATRKGLYNSKVASALATKDFDEASLAILALMDQNPQDENLKFRYASIEYERGQVDKAEAIIKELVAEKQFAKAAFWLVKKNFDVSKAANWTPTQHAEFRELMMVALKNPSSEDSKGSQLIMAKYLLELNAGQEALSYVSSLVPQNPDLALPASLLCLSLGKREEAKRFANMAVEYAQSRLTTDPTDQNSRAALARAYTIQEREKEAIAVLREGLQFSTTTDLISMQAETLIAWANRTKREMPGDASILPRVNLVGEAIKLAPNEPFVIDAIIEIALECRESKNPNAKSLVLTSLSGMDSRIIHFVRGTIATFNGDMDTAVKYLRLAEEQGINMPGLLNNLAVALHAKKEPQLEEALRFSELAIKELPDHPYFLETRGQILAKMGENEKAIRDLERALRAEELAKEVLPTLITCYKKLELDEMVRQYEHQLKQLSK